MGAVSRSTCKWCDAPIVWATTLSGKSIPLDPKVYVVGVTVEGHPGVVDFVRGRESHFATCPEADKHRKDGQVSLFDVVDEFDKVT
jgi:hypothetical protein